ncbi:hypothetical protein [Peptoanaerobacter stomatis]|uniref:hypothetical protein n=1 Tax=Peptoanaerobacter stomatis TaxID=796937 RepID=UPI0002E8A440|nr:hypothetical protein [Peptoanaerobacter stomatis]
MCCGKIRDELYRILNYKNDEKFLEQQGIIFINVIYIRKKCTKNTKFKKTGNITDVKL